MAQHSVRKHSIILSFYHDNGLADRFDSNHKGWLLAQDLEKMAIEFAKIGGIPAPDAEAVEAAVRDTKKTFGLHIDDVMTREAFADR